MSHAFNERLHSLLCALSKVLNIVFDVVDDIRASLVNGASHGLYCLIQRVQVLLDVVGDVSTGLVNGVMPSMVVFVAT